MAAQLATSVRCISGPSLPARKTRSVPCNKVVTTAGAAKNTVARKKKVVNYSKDWEKSFFGVGLFSEGKEKVPLEDSFLKKVEQKKVLSTVEKLKLLSALEKSGLSLSKIEELGLLSTAEKFGLLSLGEKAVAEPGLLAAGALPCIVVAVGTVALVPDDTTALLVAQYGVAAVAGGLGLGLFVGGQVISSIAD